MRPPQGRRTPFAPSAGLPTTIGSRPRGAGPFTSWIVVHQRYSRAFEEDLPYNVTIVELEEGPRLLTNLVEIDNNDIRPGLPVEVVWDDVTEEITLPKFRSRP